LRLESSGEESRSHIQLSTGIEMFKPFKAILIATLLAASTAGAATDDMSPLLRAKAQQAVDAGIKFLRSKQAANGSVLNSTGLTALSLTSILQNPAGAGNVDKAVIDKYANFIASKANADGSIVEQQHDQSYNTAVAITALAATKDPKYAPLIIAGQKYISKAQIGESRGFAPVDSWYGGMGYGGDERPDMSNFYIAIEALRATSYDPKDPVWQKALIFASRMQNRSESNDQKWAGNDGGFAYSPGMNPPEMGGGTNSYASVTAAGLYGLLLIGVEKSDPRVQAAYRWLTTNYTLDSNFGSNSKNTLFYFYSAFAKVMAAYGEKEFVDSRGQRHNWRNDLATKLISLQEADGSWVNHDSNVFWEDKPELATAWSVQALEHALK
jgi:squalene-hopene/tetraprenyl-beta-curcumene cyclase